MKLIIALFAGWLALIVGAFVHVFTYRDRLRRGEAGPAEKEAFVKGFKKWRFLMTLYVLILTVAFIALGIIGAMISSR